MRQPDFGSQTASPPFVGCTVLTQQGAAGAIFGGRSASRRSLEDLLLGQLELHLQPRPLRCGRRSRPKEFARGPPGMAIEDVPFKRAVRALMPPLSIRHPRPGVALIDLFQLRPDLPGVPAFLKLRLGVFERRHPIRSRHRTVHGKRPEPAQTIGTAARLGDAADLPLAGVDGVVRSVLVDSGADARRRSLRGILAGLVELRTSSLVKLARSCSIST